MPVVQVLVKIITHIKYHFIFHIYNNLNQNLHYWHHNKCMFILNIFIAECFNNILVKSPEGVNYSETYRS